MPISPVSEERQGLFEECSRTFKVVLATRNQRQVCPVASLPFKVTQFFGKRKPSLKRFVGRRPLSKVQVDLTLCAGEVQKGLEQFVGLGQLLTLLRGII